MFRLRIVGSGTEKNEKSGKNDKSGKNEKVEKSEKSGNKVKKTKKKGKKNNCENVKTCDFIVFITDCYSLIAERGDHLIVLYRGPKNRYKTYS